MPPHPLPSLYSCTEWLNPWDICIRHPQKCWFRSVEWHGYNHVLIRHRNNHELQTVSKIIDDSPSILVHTSIRTTTIKPFTRILYSHTIFCNTGFCIFVIRCVTCNIMIINMCEIDIRPGSKKGKRKGTIMKDINKWPRYVRITICCNSNICQIMWEPLCGGNLQTVRMNSCRLVNLLFSRHHQGES